MDGTSHSRLHAHLEYDSGSSKRVIRSIKNRSGSFSSRVDVIDVTIDVDFIDVEEDNLSNDVTTIADSDDDDNADITASPMI